MRGIIAMPCKMVKGQATGCADLTNAVIFTQRPELSTPARHRHPILQESLRRCVALNTPAEPFSGAVLALLPALNRVPCYRLQLASLLLNES
jgi:hypothetical protein